MEQHDDAEVSPSELEVNTIESDQKIPTLALPDDVGFGDLPPTPTDTEEHAVNDTDVFNILANLSSDVQPTFPDSEDVVFGEPLAEADFLNFPEVEEMPDAQPVATEPTEDTEDPHGTFAMPAITDGEEYFVTEVVTDEEPVQELELDVMTEHGDLPAAPLEYTVEEPATEGRRTEVSQHL